MPKSTVTKYKAPKLVVGFDGSESSLRALDQAIRFCSSWPATEVVVVQATNGEVRLLSGENIEVAQRRLLQQLVDVIEQRFALMEGQGVVIRSARAIAHLSPVEPVEALTTLAYLEGADLILVGESDKGTIERLVLGSVAEGVLRKAPCSVLVCRERKDENEPKIAPPRAANDESGHLGRRHTYYHESRNAEANTMMPLVFPMR